MCFMCLLKLFAFQERTRFSTLLFRITRHLFTETGEHLRKRPIAKYPVMDQGSGCMEASDNHQRMGENLVHFLDILRERPILNPRRCNFGQSKYWNGSPRANCSTIPATGTAISSV